MSKEAVAEVEETVEETEIEEPKEISEVLEQTIAEMRGEPEAEEDQAEEESAPEESEDDFEANLSERAQERFRELTDRAKQAEQEAAAIQQSGNELYKIMSESGVTPDDLTAYFEYHKAARNGNNAGAETYWNTLERAHSDFTGQKVGNTDPLTKYPDLQKQVEDLDINEDAARELAGLRDYAQRAREYEHQRAQEQAAYAQHSREQEEAAQWATKASKDLDAWSEERKKDDPNWAKKEELLLKRAQEVFPTIHPASWPQWVAQEYAYLSEAMPVPEAPTSPNPIRPGTSGSTATKEPKSIADALEGALREMRS